MGDDTISRPDAPREESRLDELLTEVADLVRYWKAYGDDDPGVLSRVADVARAFKDLPPSSRDKASGSRAAAEPAEHRAWLSWYTSMARAMLRLGLDEAKLTELLIGVHDGAIGRAGFIAKAHRGSAFDASKSIFAEEARVTALPNVVQCSCGSAMRLDDMHTVRLPTSSPETAKPDNSDLSKLEDLHRQATPGPWSWEATGEKDNSWCLGTEYEGDVVDFVAQSGSCENLADPKLIVEMRNALPELVGRAKRAEAALAHLEAWTHEFGAALKPKGADTYGEGVRACKAQVAAILTSNRERATKGDDDGRGVSADESQSLLQGHGPRGPAGGRDHPRPDEAVPLRKNEGEHAEAERGASRGEVTAEPNACPSCGATAGPLNAFGHCCDVPACVNRQEASKGELATLRAVADAARNYLKADDECEAKPSFRSPRWAAKLGARGVLSTLLDVAARAGSDDASDTGGAK